MRRKVFETRLAAPVESVWAFHASAEALRALTPRGRQVELISDDLAVVAGARHVIRVRQFGVPLVWVARIEVAEPPHRFVDVAERSPFRFWRHEHAFLQDGDGTLLRDSLEYELPLEPLGALAHALFVSRDLDSLFAFRHARTKELLESA